MHSHSPTRPAPPGIRCTPVAALALLLMVAGTVAAAGADAPVAAEALADTARLAVMPSPLSAQPGDTVLVELTVPVTGPAFNAYDAYLTFDPAALQYLRPAAISSQEGPLMTAACALRFHVFDADTLAGRLRISHSLLCANRSVTGPGVVYRVRFRCRDVDIDTPLTLLAMTPYRTAFFMGGIRLLPLLTTGATVRVGDGSIAGAPPPDPAVAVVAQAGAFPNPFNPRTTITFVAGAAAGETSVTIHAVDGRRVRRLWTGTPAPGTWNGEWDGRDDEGRVVAAGVYLVRVEAGNHVAACRVALVR